MSQMCIKPFGKLFVKTEKKKKHYSFKINGNVIFIHLSRGTITFLYCKTTLQYTKKNKIKKTT